MGKKSGPSAPDPAATAAAQGAANKEAVDASAADTQINQVTPYGSVTYSGTVGDPSRTQTTTLSPDSQTQLNQQNQVAESLGNSAQSLTGQVANEAAQPFNYDGIAAGPTDYTDMVNNATNTAYGQLTNNLNRDFDRSDETAQAKLASQGISQNSPAYERAMEAQGNSRDSALNTAALNASQLGQTEEQNAYNQDTTTRQNQINQALTLRQEPMNELSAILQGTPAFTPQSTPATGQYNQAPVDTSGIINSTYQNQLNQANQQASKFGSTVSNLGGLGLAGYSILSDEDLKENMEPVNVSILDKLLELPVEYWNYKPEAAKKLPGDNGVKHIGCYAGDFKDLFGVGDGHQISVVDIFGVLTQAIKQLTTEVRALKNG